MINKADGEDGMEDRHGVAAVGLLIKDGNILFIKRAERVGDPWSGQIALPGGFLKENESGEDAVVREIYEETSIKLDKSSILRKMPVQNPLNRRRVTVHPYVLSVKDYSDAVPGPEVQDIRVVRLSDLEHREAYFNGWDAYLAGDWVIWGLTYKILSSFFGEDAESVPPNYKSR